MAVEDPPGVLDTDSTPSSVQRHTTQGLLGVPVGAFAGGVGAAAGGGHGVCGAADLLVTQSAAPGMSVDVANGIAFVVGNVSAAQGPYSFYNDATVTLSISPAHATLVRRDLIVAQIQDATYSGAVRSARLLVVTGTAGSGTDPSLAGTPNALVLARVTVPAAASSILNANITDLRTRASSLGAVRFFADAATRNAELGSSAKGVTAYLLTTSQLTICDGTGWIILSEPAQTWTPTWNGFTGGTQTSTGYYHRSDGWCEFQAKLQFGGTPSAISGAQLVLPIQGLSVEQNELRVGYGDNGGFRYPGLHDPGTTAVSLYAQNASGTYVNNNGALSLTVPFTFQANDYVAVQGRYRMNTPYL